VQRRGAVSQRLICNNRCLGRRLLRMALRRLIVPENFLEAAVFHGTKLPRLIDTLDVEFYVFLRNSDGISSAPMG
jgi:hypothetical protein